MEWDGCAVSDAHTFLITAAHLYNAMKYLSALPAPWSAMGAALNSHCAALFGVPTPPTTAHPIYNRFYIRFGISVTQFARDVRVVCGSAPRRQKRVDIEPDRALDVFRAWFAPSRWDGECSVSASPRPAFP
jgi:hypothetical protein